MRRISLSENDNSLFATVLALIAFGLIMISSAGVFYGQVRFEDPYYHLKGQLLNGAIPGLLLMLLARKIDYHYWKKVSFPIFAASIIFLLFVFVPGIGYKVYGAMRWIAIGPITFQPSELAKLSLILYLSTWLVGKGEKSIKDFYEGFVPFLGILGLVAVLIIKQPDMGTLGVLVAIAVSIYFVAGARLDHLFGLLLAGLGFLAVLIKIEPYRFDRITAFFDRGADPQGIGYQINQALIAIGSGGFFGLGLGHSRQKFNYLPETVGDSIFAIIGEELGFVGAVFLVFLFAIIAYRGFRIAKKAPDDFGRLVAIGITVWIITQALINISANLALIPLTGIPLPFISYGGTSLMVLLFSVGILMNISRQTK